MYPQYFQQISLLQTKGNTSHIQDNTLYLKSYPTNIFAYLNLYNTKSPYIKFSQEATANNIKH